MWDPSPGMGTTRVAVIGGGIAGVSVAHHLLQLDPDLDVIFSRWRPRWPTTPPVGRRLSC
ncbi:hypothetical protein CM1200mP19_1970 [bacterium]|nr:MAG: hypothetical protein CM1200mP19_1970 [bacterium]